MMIVNWRLELGKFWIVISLALSGVTIPFSGRIALAQITPDDTLGNEASVVTKINELEEQIDGGALRESNLFHSFREFNIGEGRAAYFSNPAAVQNIFSRVTGSNPSRLLGKLGVLGDANLFFLNPNGIIFGPHSSLDIRGSFLASTASSLKFPEGTEFSATNPSAPPLLTINVKPPVGLLFEGSGEFITNEGNLAAGQDLTLSAGNLDLQGQLQAGKNLTLQATDQVKIRDSVAQPFIASAVGKLVVQGNQGVDIFALNHPNSGFFSGGDLVLGSANSVVGDAHYWSGGNFRIERLDGNLGNWFSFYDPIIRARGDVSFDSYTGASLHILAGGSVKIPGEVTITGPDTVANSIQGRVALSDGTTVVDIDGSAQPTLDIRAGTTAFGTPGITGSTDGFSAVPSTGGTGTSAEIDISRIANNGGVVFLTNQYQPNPALSGGITVGSIETSSALGGGPVAIDSRGGIAVNGSVNVSGTSDDPFSFNFSGNGGDVTLLANGDITLVPDSNILSFGLLGGNITLKSDADISVTSGLIDSISSSPVRGTVGGDIEIITRSLSVTNGAELGTFSFGEANAGSVIIQASESVSVDGKGLPTFVGSQVLSGAGGNGGNVKIETERLRVQDGAGVSASTFGDGNAGELTVQAQSVEVIGTSADGEVSSGLGASVEAGAGGNGGSLTINTERLRVQDGAQVSAATFGDGEAGDVRIETGQLIVQSGGTISASSTSGGSGGSITVTTNIFELTEGGQLRTTTSGRSDAGNITLDVEESITLTEADSGLFANTESGSTGNGGSIFIDPRILLIQDDARIAVDSQGTGEGGNIFLRAGSLTLERGTITAETVSNQGGNINLTISDLLTLRNNSQITATAGTDEAGGDGGNITIDAPFIIAFPNEDSNIQADAFEGDGGNITINTNGILGIEFRDEATPLSDITASSEFGQQGEVEINASAIDPTRGLTNLPEETVESEVAEGCQAEAVEPDVAFYDIGRGGLPPRLDEPFSIEALIVPLIPFDVEGEDKTVQTWEEIFTISEMKGKFSLTPACRDK